jgi:pimeloyl-ACP methyl ester carboxylesterase
VSAGAQPGVHPPPELNVHREGRGKPVVLVHGIGHHWQAFTPVIGRLAGGGYAVHALDMPGFGRSAPLPGEDLAIPAYADALAAWIGAAGLGTPAVVGNSMGGAIALELVRRGAASSAVAISPAGFWTDAERRYCQVSLGMLAGMPAPLRPAVLRAAGTGIGRRMLFAQTFGRPARMPGPEAQATLRDAWAAPSFPAALAAFERYRFQADGIDGARITVVWGSRDLLLPYGLQAPRARRELPRARHVTLPGLGHVPFWDDPGMVARVILGVLG